MNPNESKVESKFEFEIITTQELVRNYGTIFLVGPRKSGITKLLVHLYNLCPETQRRNGFLIDPTTDIIPIQKKFHPDFNINPDPFPIAKIEEQKKNVWRVHQLKDILEELKIVRNHELESLVVSYVQKNPPAMMTIFKNTMVLKGEQEKKLVQPIFKSGPQNLRCLSIHTFQCVMDISSYHKQHIDCLIVSPYHLKLPKILTHFETHWTYSEEQGFQRAVQHVLKSKQFLVIHFSPLKIFILDIVIHR